MKILLITHNFPPLHGGISVFLDNLYRQLRRQGHKVFVLVFEAKETGIPPKQRVADSFCVYRTKLPGRMSSLFILYKLVRMVRQHRPEVVFLGHEISSDVLGIWFVRKLFGIKSVMLVHGTILQWYLHDQKGMTEILARLALSESTLILTNSIFTRQKLLEEGINNNKVAILYPGVNKDEFKPSVDTLVVTKRYKLRGRRVIMTVSRLVARKGHEAVLRALPNVIRQVPTVLYLIAGQGNIENRLRKVSRDLNIQKHVVFAGYVEQELLPALYCACDVFIMPSSNGIDIGRDYEGFGIVFTEANACGKPVIGGRSGGIEDAVLDGVTGLLVDPENVEEISKTIIMLLTDLEYAKELGINGRKRVENELSWVKVGKRLECYLESVISKENA